MNASTTTVRAGQTWADCERGQIRVVAVADGYAMLKRRRRNPFLASTDQMLAGEYGWELVSEAPESAAPARSGAQQQGQPPGWYARREQHAREMGYAGLAEALADLERRRQPTQQGGREVAWQLLDTAPRDGTLIALANVKAAAAGSWSQWPAEAGRPVWCGWPYIHGEPTRWQPMPRAVARAQQPAAGQVGACMSTLDPEDESWDGACGAKWQFNDDGPVENGMRYCPECGKRLATQHQEPTTRG